MTTSGVFSIIGWYYFMLLSGVFFHQLEFGVPRVGREVLWHQRACQHAAGWSSTPTAAWATPKFRALRLGSTVVAPKATWHFDQALKPWLGWSQDECPMVAPSPNFPCIFNCVTPEEHLGARGKVYVKHNLGGPFGRSVRSTALATLDQTWTVRSVSHVIY